MHDGPVKRVRNSAPDRAADRAADRIASENRSAATLSDDDARSILALRVREQLQGGTTAILTPERRSTLLTTATMLGLRPFDANLIIAIVQDAARRGEGVEHPQTDGRLKMVPPAGSRAVRAKRERSFAIAIVASIVIAFVMLVLAIRWVLGG